RARRGLGLAQGRPQLLPAAAIAGARGAVGIRGGGHAGMREGEPATAREPWVTGPGATQPALVDARTALSRAVVTARESRAVAALFETLAGRGEAAAQPALTG